MRKIVFLMVAFSLTNLIIAQTNISGIINDYSDVTAINSSTNSIDVSSATNFSVGDKVLLIQMQGATIDETQNNTFGTILDYGNSGNYEFLTICNKNGNTIYFDKTMLNTYDVMGKVQLVSVPQYTNAVIFGGDLSASPWNGTTGGVLVFDVEGTLDFGTQNINVDGLGFNGGQAVPSGNGCSFLDDESYFTDLTSTDETALKGEGIAIQIPTKECGRGPQANGGGGGNNHNGGGSGGANYGFGGAGGQRVKSSTFTCGSVVGVNSMNLVQGYANGKLFLGGGGGAGHGNNAGILGESGLNGGGIVIISATTLNGNGQTINANGISATQNTEGEGGGGGGAGGTVFISSTTISSTLNVNANGGKGTDVDNIGTSNCNGPGGGGGGGLIWVNTMSVPTNLMTSVQGGISGVITSTSQSNCTVGSSNGGQNGEDGAVLTDLALNESTAIFNSAFLTETACKSYTSPSGNYVWTTTNVYNDTLYGAGLNGCDSILIIDLTINTVDTSVSLNGSVLSANLAGQSYQWVDCDNNYGILNGATNQSFTPLANGNYAVIITTANCVDTSSCYAITTIGVLENTFTSKIDIYPNPTQGQLTINLNQAYKTTLVTVKSMEGKIISTEKFKNKSQLNILIDAPKAYYLIEIETKSGYKAVVKVLKI